MTYVKEYLRRTTTRYGETFGGIEFEPLRVPVKCGAMEWFPDPIFVPRKAIVCVKAIASAAGTISMRLDCEER